MASSSLLVRRGVGRIGAGEVVRWMKELSFRLLKEMKRAS